VVDLATLYPAQYTPALSTALHRYQAEAYKDAFFVAGGEGDVPFFKFFTWMEAAVHVPVALWSLGALVRGTLPLVFCGFVLFVLFALRCVCAVGNGNGSGFGRLGRQRRFMGRRRRERTMERGERADEKKDDYKIPIVLLAYAVQTTVTTATCIWDYVSWTGIDATAKWHLTSLYGPYLLLGEYYLVPSIFDREPS
jgi:hypothetical protein